MPAVKKKTTAEIDTTVGKAEEAYQKIKNMIRYYHLVPGQKLVYQDLAEKLNLSITPIMQALNRLESSNLVTYKQNRGYFVGEITEDELKELYEARLALDIHIAQGVIDGLNRGKKDHTDDIRKAFRVHNEASTPDSRRLSILRDSEFHLAIARFSGNNYICKLQAQIFELIFLRWKPNYLTNDRLKNVIEEHRAILSALGDGDRDRYVEAITKHARGGLAYIIGTLKSERLILSQI